MRTWHVRFSHWREQNPPWPCLVWVNLLGIMQCLSNHVKLHSRLFIPIQQCKRELNRALSSMFMISWILSLTCQQTSSTNILWFSTIFWSCLFYSALMKCCCLKISALSKTVCCCTVFCASFLVFFKMRIFWTTHKTRKMMKDATIWTPWHHQEWPTLAWLESPKPWRKHWAPVQGRSKKNKCKTSWWILLMHV